MPAGPVPRVLPRPEAVQRAGPAADARRVIKFRCIACSKKVGVSDAAAGKRARCPQCSTVMRVPVPERVVEADLALAAAEPVMKPAMKAAAATPPPPERRRARAPRPPGGDFTVAGEVLTAPAAAGVHEPVAQEERRIRQDAMDSLAGLAAVSDAAPQMMNFGSGVNPSPKRKKRSAGPRVPTAVHPACGTCGTTVLASARFCTACGAALKVPDLPVDNNPIALPMTVRPPASGWKAGFWGWLLGAR
ncbi:zinc-ribbon domain-containing protein [Phycisphaera mikurensis]|uniref:Zinc-ribbon domain-containing protein n=1 Tax=Phycisphaera mikurensis (strain NBRC 102666 / KCTC 22515 / FYK2301M01) TaxID=1142394 RepID=I0IFI3_PHYMF|nr:zinc ribbon domain-containing protein [Phycisphaera mikurensis]MBB6440587.1 DNA-directed RNA polymerase subunit RPC12/RpoP [Phycisphaera mikurensis]BAM04021.1 hypothetical protein PSMK_18620 [Phycisphaera mikurensis NBRC 102666]